MCDAISIGVGVTGVATLMKGVAQGQQGTAAKAADYQSADAADRAAAEAIDKGKLRDMQVAMHASSVVATQRVIQSGGGFDVNVGGVKATQDASTAVSEVDRKVVQRNAALEAYGLRSRAGAFRQQGEYAEAEGKNAMAGTFLSGLAKMGGEFGKWYGDQAPEAGPQQADGPVGALQAVNLLEG